ncbi:LysE family transporter [Actinospica durhamensis]|uniref:LysE family transporter n=1 Tax=Actinospica durhamensis TaxID=1508375 RepID=A0A941EU34_9ACTN|nr:LysE family transporter [Actinospica durhamensis]MBR7837263.1 LysE family transporter [Actinospica durhamensis]
MTGILVAGLLAGFGIAVQVGAITVLIMTLSAHHSLRTGLAAGLGTATADALYALTAATAGAGVAALLRPIAEPMRDIASAVLILIAARGVVSALRARRAAARAAAASAAPASDSAPAEANAPDLRVRRPLGAYFQVLGLTILNPLTIIYFSVLVLGLHNGHSWSVADGAVFVLATFAASACWQSVLALGGAALGHVLTGARGRLGSALVGNAVIALLAVHLLMS